MKRQNFLKLGLLGIAASAVKPLFSQSHFENVDSGDKLNNGSNDTKIVPKMVSTWAHGQAANKAGWEMFKQGKSSLDMVEAGARQSESDVENRSVGIGGRPDANGKVTLDACIMDWEARCGSVGYLEGIAHPISVARHIMENTPHVMLVGAGAKEYALKNKFETIKTPLPEVKADYKKWKAEKERELKKPRINHENHDTIGLLAIDANGKLSGACTTSGWAYKLAGRLGDSPIIGAGLFIDQEVGACVATGLGESIIRVAGSHTVVELMRHGRSPQEACKEAVLRLMSKHKDMTGNQCAFLAMDKFGNVGAYSVYEGFDYALKTDTEDKMVRTPFEKKW